MASRKSKLYTVDGKRYAFGFDSNGKINSISQASSGGRSKTFTPVNPNTSAFSDIVNSNGGVRAYNVNKFKGNKKIMLIQQFKRQHLNSTLSISKIIKVKLTNNL